MHLHIKLLSFILAVLVNLSWAEVTPTLNSDAIKATFGSYGVEVISQSESTRVANLYSLSGDAKICRTLAVTEFVLPMDTTLTEAHRLIRAGGSIGATLRSAGFTINKKLNGPDHKASLEPNELKSMIDLKKFEILILFSLVVPIIFFGFYPEPLINSIEVSVENLLNIYNTNIQTNLAFKN